MKKRFNARMLFNLLSRIFKLYQDVPPTDITLSWKKHSQSISVLSCSVQLFWNRLDSYYKVLYYTQFRPKKEQFLLNLPSARNSKLSKSRITECTSEWYVFIRWWLVGSEMDLVIEWGVLTRYRGVNLFHEGLSRD